MAPRGPSAQIRAPLRPVGAERSVEGFAVSGGGGLLARLGDRLNGELGVTVGKECYDGNAADGATVVTRLGLAIGLG